MTDTVKQLVIINVIFFIGSWIVGPPAIEYLAMHFPANPDFKVWQIFTYMFMHGGLMHILFNMLGLIMFGSPLEHFWGQKKFIFFYVSCGLGAVALHVGIEYYFYQDVMGILTKAGFNKSDILGLISQDKFNTEWLKYITEDQIVNFRGGYFSTMLGASGALYGLIVAFAFMFPNAELMLIFLPIPVKAKYFVPGLLCLDLFLGLKGQAIFGFGDDGIAHFAHLGGALIGFIMMWYWKKNNFNHKRWN